MKTVKRVRLKQVCDGRIQFAVDRISRPREVYDAVMPYYKGADREILSVLCLDAQNQPNSFNVASIGALNTTRTRPAEILKAELIGVDLYDHVIVTDDGFTSLRERGLL
jgi:DNA repair protein RadC